MIDTLLDNIKDVLNTYLCQQMGVPDEEGTNKIIVEDISNRESTTSDIAGDSDSDQIFITLVNIEEETILKNNYPVRQEGAVFVKEQSSLFLNLYLLFSSANFTSYTEGLRQISRVIQYFQANRRLDFYTDNGHCEVRFNLYNIGFENLNNLWTVLGGRYVPSIIIIARLVQIQASPPIGGPTITDIEEPEPIQS